MASTQIKSGDLFEIETSVGKVYLHYVDRIRGQYRIRVLQGAFNTIPPMDAVARLDERFWIKFPLKAAHNKNIVKRVGNMPVESLNRPTPSRRMHKIRGEFLGWFIVDEETREMTFVEKLTEDQLKLSPSGIWNDTLLISRIEEGWSLENWK